MYLCLFGLIACGVVMFFAVTFPAVWDTVRKWFSLPSIEKVLVAIFTIGLVYIGSTKSSFRYDGGIRGGHSYTTNNLVHVEWVRDTSQMFVPESAAVYIDYRPKDVPDTEEWGLLGQATVGDWMWEDTLANAELYDFSIWAYYIPPEPVHTNGVWAYKTLKDRNGKYAIPLRARIQVNGKAIATPAEKRKDEERDEQ